MSTNATLNGVTYAIPATGDGGWGTVVSNYLIALSTGTLTKAGGSFTLTAEVDFGGTYGVKAPYVTSKGTNPSSSGVVRLANTQAVSWRNAANSANLDLIANASNRLSFGGVVVPTISSTDTLTNKTIDGASNTVTGLTDSSIASGAAIAYSKLALTGAVTNSDLAGSIAYSKLALTGAILNADLAGSIAFAKLAALTAGNVLVGNASNVATSTALSGDITIDSSGVTAIGSSKVTNNMLAGSIAYTKLAALTAGNVVLGNASNVATSTAVTGDITIDSSGVTAIGASKVTNSMLAGSIAYSKLSLTGAILNADLAGSIAYSKLSLTGALQNSDLAGAVSIAKGGTGQTTANAALNALLPDQTLANGLVLTSNGSNTSWTNVTGLTNPMTSVGDIIVGGASGAATRLAVGASGTVLKGGTVAWAQIVDADVDAAASIAHSKLANTTAAYVLMGNASGVVTGTALSGDITVGNTGVTAIGAGKVTNSMLAGSIAFSNLATLTSGNILVGNGSNVAASVAVTGDVTISNAGVTTIGASKVTNSMLAGSIAYSKLSLTGAILNADLAGSIAFTKLASLSPGNILVGNGSSVATSVAVTGDVTINSSGVTAIGSGKVTNAMLAGSIAYSNLSLSNSVVNADISSSAAIAGSKLQAASSSNVGTVSYEAAGSFTVNWIQNALAHSSTTCYYVRVGNKVTLHFNSNVNTSKGATDITAAAVVPAGIRPIIRATGPFVPMSGGAIINSPAGLLIVDTNGNLTLRLQPDGVTNFSASGNCGMYWEATISYRV